MNTALMAIDPKNVHVGWARFDRIARDATVHAGEVDPARLMSILVNLARYAPDCVILVEEWRLYPQTARTQIGSNIPTSQLIGAIRYVAQLNNLEVVMQPADMRRIGAAWVRSNRPN